eukprot:10102125-Ditylum_brightwellii.AAC.1
MSERISMIKDSFCTRIRKLERKLYTKGRSSTGLNSPAVMLIRLETELGVDQNENMMFSRILALKESINKMNKHFSDIEKKVFQ